MVVRLGVRTWRVLSASTTFRRNYAVAQQVSTPRPAPKQSEEDILQAKTPFDTLKGIIRDETLRAVVGNPFNISTMSPVQAEVLPLLPDLALPFNEDKPDKPRDLMVKAKTGTGKTLAFLIPALEARLNEIERRGQLAVEENGLQRGRTVAVQAERIFAKEKVGTLIISPTRELATQIANEAVRLSSVHSDPRVQLFVGGVSKRMQMRDWVRNRRDFVVATPGRLRDLLHSEPDFPQAFSDTQLLVLDEADTLLDMGFRDDIEDIVSFLPKTPTRQTFLFSATVSPAITQIARKTLDRRHAFIDTVGEETSPVHSHIPQYHTVLSKASDLIPQVLRLIAHDQLSNIRNSKIIIFFPTTRMTQLFGTIIRQLSNDVLPAGPSTSIYEIHSKKAQDSRANTSDSFRNDKTGASILITSDVSARGVDYPNVSRVIQVGIPSSHEQYVHRIGRTGRRGMDGRGDFVLLPWEVGFVTWQLTDIPLKPLTSSETVKQLEELAEKCDTEGIVPPPNRANSERRRYGPQRERIVEYKSPVKPRLDRLEETVKDFLPRLDPEAVEQTFAASLGYYFSKSGELRTSKDVILEGCRDFTVEALGLPEAPYTSQAFLQKLGYSDGRTTRFGQGNRNRNQGGQQAFGQRNRWDHRGSTSNRRTPTFGMKKSNGDDGSSRDPAGDPGEYRTSRYGNPRRDYKRDVAEHTGRGRSGGYLPRQDTFGSRRW